MGWVITKQRSLEPPPWVNEMLRNIFGINDFGGAMFKVVWGMTPVRRISKVEGGYEWQSPNRQAWLIKRWVSPTKWGSPQLFNLINTDPANGQVLFPYPEFGEYETIKELGDRALDPEMMHSTVPFLQAIFTYTKAQVESYKERQKELVNRAQVEEISDRMMDVLPTRYGPVSYGRGGCRTSLLDQKIEQIQRVWNQYDKQQLQKLNTGIAQGRPGG